VSLQIDGDHAPSLGEAIGDGRVEGGVVQAAMQDHQRRAAVAAHLVMKPQSTDVRVS